jgi:hypothetical protein
MRPAEDGAASAMSLARMVVTRFMALTIGTSCGSPKSAITFRRSRRHALIVRARGNGEPTAGDPVLHLHPRHFVLHRERRYCFDVVGEIRATQIRRLREGERQPIRFDHLVVPLRAAGQPVPADAGEQAQRRSTAAAAAVGITRLEAVVLARSTPRRT